MLVVVCVTEAADGKRCYGDNRISPFDSTGVLRNHGHGHGDHGDGDDDDIMMTVMRVTKDTYGTMSDFLSACGRPSSTAYCLLTTFEGVTVTVTVVPSPDLFCRHLDCIVFSTEHHPLSYA